MQLAGNDHNKSAVVEKGGMDKLVRLFGRFATDTRRSIFKCYVELLSRSLYPLSFSVLHEMHPPLTLHQHPTCAEVKLDSFVVSAGGQEKCMLCRALGDCHCVSTYNLYLEY